MTIQMFDLAGARDDLRFSPYCWRTRMALLHKGLPFATVPWRFTEKDALTPSGQGRVPVIIDQGRWIADSWAIAEYLDATYPDRPLMADERARTFARFIGAWCGDSIFPHLRFIAVPHIHGLLHEKDKAYFRASRERMLGRRLEDLAQEEEAARARLKAALAPAEAVLARQPFLAGTAPDYGDITLFGSLMWPYVVCPRSPLEPVTAVAAWFGRMLDLHDGHARGAPTARTAGG